MPSAVLILVNDAIRAAAHEWINKAKDGSRITFAGPKRTLPQNDRLQATLTDIARQRKYHGVRLTPEEWKWLFLDALDREVRVVPSLDGRGFVNLGRSSSQLSKEDFSDLLAIIEAWCAEKGVILSAPER